MTWGDARYFPRPATRTYRNQIKREVRNYLGTLKDGAPSTRNTLIAARHMARLVGEASDGELRLVLQDRRGNALSWPDAITASDRRLDA